ncbi:MAG: heavy metal transporter [Cyclobacteriaceae bacterium]|nr:heavy metal transporter [Cyclobacteriaceae bacterium]
MMKIIRPTYPKEISIGLLLLIFVISFLLSSQLFDTPVKDLDAEAYIGMTLVSIAVIIMVMVLWEEFLFPIHVKPVDGGLNLRNHRNKLKKQLLIYLAIPFIFVFIYMNHEVNHVRFFIWSGICVVFPIVGKLFTGLKNYNDFLTLTNTYIEYRNNEKVGKFGMQEIKALTLIKDERKVLHKFQLTLVDGRKVMIDLDEMELEAFYEAIDKFIEDNYGGLVGV